MRIEFVKNGLETIKRLAMGRKEKNTQLISSIFFLLAGAEGQNQTTDTGIFSQ
jgi:hypothetical protein